MAAGRTGGIQRKYEDDAEKSEACVLVFFYYIVSDWVSRRSDRLFFMSGNAGKKMGDYVIDHGDEQIEHDDVLGCAKADGALLRQKHLAAVGKLRRGDDGTKGGIFDAVLKHRR